MPSAFDELMAIGSPVPDSTETPVTPQRTESSGKWPGLLTPLIKGFLVRAPEYGAGSSISGVHEFVPGDAGDFFQKIGERISEVAPQDLRNEVEQTSSIPWFEDDGSPWYNPTSWSPQRLPDVASKAMSMFGENIPLMMQTAATSWLGQKIAGAVAGAGLAAIPGSAGPQATEPIEEISGGILGAFFSDLVVPSVFMGLSEARNFAKQAREAGLDEDIAAENARLYGPASGIIETMQSYASFGAKAAGRAGKLVDPKAVKGMRYTLSKMLSMGGIKLPEEMEEGMEEVSQGFISNKLMERAVSQMKARYGADWEPSKPLLGYSLTDAANDFAGGALIAGMIRGTGYASRMMMGRVDAKTEEKAQAVMGSLRDKPAATYVSTIDSDIENAVEAHDRDTGKKGGITDLTKRQNEQIDAINATRSDENALAKLNTAKIASLWKSGDKEGAREEFARQAGISLVVPDGSTGEQIMNWIQDKKGKDIKLRKDNGRAYIVATPDLISTPADALKFSGIARVEENYADRGKWAVDININDRETLAQALEIPNVDQADGTVDFTPEGKKRLDDVQAGLKAITESDLFRNNGGTARVNFAGYLRMTPQQLRDTGNENLLTEANKNAETILVKMGGSNRIEENGKPVLELFPSMTAYHLGEEVFELATKVDSKEAGAFHDTINDIYHRVANIIETQAGMAEGTRQQVTNISDPLKIKGVLSAQVSELIKTAERGQIPPKTIRTNEIRETNALQARVDALDGMSENERKPEALSIEKAIRSKQTQYGKLTFHDQMLDLHAWVTRARDAVKGKADRRELISKMWAMQQMGGSRYVSEDQKRLIKFLHFTPTEAKALESHLRGLVGDKAVDWMTKEHFAAQAEALPLPAKPVVAEPTSFTMQDEKKVVTPESTLIPTVQALVEEVRLLRQQISGRTTSETVTPPVNPASSQAEVVAPPIQERVQTAPQSSIEPVVDQTTPLVNKPATEASKPIPVPVDPNDPDEILAQRIQQEIDRKIRADAVFAEDDDTHSTTIVTDQIVALIRDEQSMDQNAANEDEESSKVTGIGGDQSKKFDQEQVKYKPFMDLVKALVGSQSRTEVVAMRAANDPEFIAAVNATDDNDVDTDPALLAEYLKLKPTDRYEEKIFKLAVKGWMNSKMSSASKGVDLLRSFQRFYSVYVPVPNGFYSIRGTGFSKLDKNQFRIINRYNRAEELTKKMKARLDFLFTSKAERERIQAIIKTLPPSPEINARSVFSSLIADVYGIDHVMLASITNEATWKGIGTAFSSIKGKLLQVTPNEHAYKAILDVMTYEPGNDAMSNVRNIVTYSGDSEGYGLHGKDQSKKNAITAMVKSPALKAITQYAAELKQRVDQVVRYVRGVKGEDADSWNWDAMDAYQRSIVQLAEAEQGDKTMGFYRVVPLGDKTDGFFMKYPRLAGKEGIAAYKKIYDALDAKSQALFQTPDEVAKEAASTPSFSRPDSTGKVVDRSMDAEKYASMIISTAAANVDMYGRLYGNLGMYAYNAEKIMKRGSQIPSGGPIYPKGIRVLFVKGIGATLKLGDGAIFHSGEFAKSFKKHMGSEYNSDVIKPYIRTDEFGVKSASYNIEMFSELQKQSKAYQALAELFKANPDITHIIDDTSVKFETGITFADAFNSDLSLKQGTDYTISKKDVKPGSLFLVQNIDKSADAVRGLLSRQMIYATSHLPHAVMREKIANDILDALYAQFRSTSLALDAEGKPVNGTLAESILAKALQGDRNEGLRRALLENKESQENILNNSGVVNAIFSIMRKLMEPKANVHSGVQVPAFDLNLPKFEADGKSGANHLPWNRSNLLVKAGKTLIAPRASMAFPDSTRAYKYMVQNYRQFLDLAKIDENGIPIMGENGVPKFLPTSIRKHDGQYWIPGTIDWSARIPSDSLLSAAPYHWAGPIQGGSDIGLALITEEGRKNNGADFDADSLFNATYFVDADGNPFFTPPNENNPNDVIKALMNRRLRLLVADYQETSLDHLVAGKENDIEELKKIFHRLGAETKAKSQYKINSQAFREQAMNVFSAGMRMLGIAAKSNSANDVESTTGVFWNHEIDLGNGLKLSLTEQEAKRLASKAGLNDRLYRKTVIGRAFINALVDDSGNPVMGYLFNYDTIPLTLAALQGMRINAGNIEESIGKVVAFLKSDIIAGKNGYLEVLSHQRLSGAKFDGLFNSMLAKTYGQERAIELAKLIAVSKSRMIVGRISDFAVAAKRPRDMNQLDRFTSDLEKATGQSMMPSVVIAQDDSISIKDWEKVDKKGKSKEKKVIEVYNLGELPGSTVMESAQKYINSIRDQASNGPVRAIETVVARLGKFKDAAVRNEVRMALQRAMAIKAVSPSALDVKGLPRAFKAMSQAYPEGHAARKFLDRLIVAGPDITVITDWRTGDYTEAELKEAQAGWDALTPEDQTKLAVYQFSRYGIDESMYTGGFISLMGPKWRIANNDALSNPMAINDPDVLKYAEGFVPEFGAEKQNYPNGRRPFFTGWTKTVAQSESASITPHVVENWKTLSDYKGIPIVYTTGMFHQRGKYPLGARSTVDADGNRIIKLDPKVLEQNFKDKQWSKPRVPGVIPLPADFFKTSAEWVSHVLEHEYQHTQIPTPEGVRTAEQYAADEMAIDDAALQARGLPKRTSFANSDSHSLSDPKSVVVGLYDSEEDRMRSVVDVNGFEHVHYFGYINTEAGNRWRFNPRTREISFYEYPEQDVLDSVRTHLLEKYGIKGTTTVKNYGNNRWSYSSSDSHSMTLTKDESLEARSLIANIVPRLKFAIQSGGFPPDTAERSALEMIQMIKNDPVRAISDMLEQLPNDPVVIKLRSIFSDKTDELVHPEVREHITEEDIRNYPLLFDSHSISLVHENDSVVPVLDSGKYGVHKAYYRAREELDARTTEVAGLAQKWRKVIGFKRQDVWEMITRWIDDPSKFASQFNALKSDEKKVAEEVRDFYKKQLAYFNDMLEGLTDEEWIKRRKDYINRIYVPSQSGEAMRQRDMNTKHAERRMFKTISEAEAAGYKLAKTDAAELVMIYAHETTETAQARLMFHSAFMVRDQEGDSHIIPIFHGEPSIAPRLKASAKASGNQVAGNMADLQNEVHSDTSSWSSIRNSIAKLTGKFKPETKGYAWKASPFAEYAGFWVHPDSLDVAASMLGERWDNRTVNTLLHVGAWSKFMTLGLSLFHHVAMAEATVAALHGKAFKLKNGIIPVWAWQADQKFKEEMEDPVFVGNWIRSGLKMNPYPNIDNGIITKDLDRAIAWAKDRGNKPALAAMGALKRYKGFMDLHLWTNFHAKAKLYTAWFSYKQRLDQLSREGKDVDDGMLREQIAEGINIGFGGMPWDRWMFATPKTRQFLQMSLLAPDWTVTNLNSMRALLSNVPMLGFLGKDISTEARRWSLMKHWPGMAMIMVMWPQVVQAMLYLAFKGNPDDHDEIFSAWNEEGKRFHIDVTPMFRTLGWTSKDNPNERIYMKFAKQAWEVVDMAEDPINKIMSKGNPVVKMALEQITGVDGIGRPVPFKSENFWTGLFTSEDGFVGSRTATVAGKFIPMSILSWLGGKPPSWIAPTSKGMIKGTAIHAAKEVMEAYADPSLWSKITGKDGYEEKLDILIPEILEAAKRNGVNPKDVVNAATIGVRSKYYDKFWKAMNRGKEGEMIEAAESIVRLHGAMSGFHDSMSNRYRAIEGSKYSADKRTLVSQFYWQARQEITKRERTARAVDALLNPPSE